MLKEQSQKMYKYLAMISLFLTRLSFEEPNLGTYLARQFNGVWGPCTEKVGGVSKYSTLDNWDHFISSLFLTCILIPVPLSFFLKNNVCMVMLFLIDMIIKTGVICFVSEPYKYALNTFTIQFLPNFMIN